LLFFIFPITDTNNQYQELNPQLSLFSLSILFFSFLYSTGRNDFVFDIWLLHGDLYRVSPFQVYRTSASCLQCDLELFMFAVIETFVTDISASTGRNDFIFDIWLLHGDLYHVSPFQVDRTSTSCLPCDLEYQIQNHFFQ
jgi:hypothetical protein